MNNSNAQINWKSIVSAKRALTIFTIWITFHLFALITSYSQINVFNALGQPETSQFWPFVSFTRNVIETDPSGKQDTDFITKPALTSNAKLAEGRDITRNKKVQIIVTHSEALGDLVDTINSRSYYHLRPHEIVVSEFNGVFTQYDWSEFTMYVGGLVVIYVLSKLLK